MNFHQTKTKAFTLIEIMVVAAGIMILAGVWLRSSIAPLISHKIAAEDETLTQLSRDIEHTFEDIDLTNVNIASFPGQIGGGDLPTTFSVSTSAVGPTATTDWFARLARYRGVPVAVGANTDRATQPQLARLVWNGYNQPRLLIAAPAEANQQRYLLFSLMARPEELTLPAYQNTQAWFDAIWNADFATAAGTAPAAWSSQLGATQLAAWAGQLNRLRVVRITQKKWTLTINNNHLTNAGWAYWNNGTGRLQATANSGANISPQILAGRQIKITSGLSEAAAGLKDQILIRRDVITNID